MMSDRILTPFNEENFVSDVDLVEGAKKQLHFLSAIETCVSLHRDENVINNALYRYAKFWLPLAAGHTDTHLAAPLDIEWAWHCHMLSPIDYVKDCKALVGVVIDHKLLTTDERKHKLRESYDIWLRTYPSEPFEVLEGFNECFEARQPKYHIMDELKFFSYDIKAAMSRQKSFFYQVSLPHYRDETFLSEGLKRYRKFLYLKQQNEHLFLVPCYDIDLIWHTHQLHPNIYSEDTRRIIGRLFNHDDTVVDRSLDSKLTQSDILTRELWRNTFNENFATYGAMYRGEPLYGKVSKLLDLYKYSTKRAEIYMSNIVVTGLMAEQAKFKLAIAKAYVKKRKTKYHWLVNAKHNDAIFYYGTGFTYFTERDRGLLVELKYRAKTGMCCTTDIKLGQANVDLVATVESCPPGRGTSSYIVLPLDPASVVTVSFNMGITPPRADDLRLSLSLGEYTTVTSPEYLELLWGPVPLRRHPSETENTCQVASHRLLGHAGNVVFTCRIIHSLPLLMSAIQVYFRNKMVAVCHIIGTDQLPIESQLFMHRLYPNLKPEKGQRAILIKNFSGDWGILYGHWTGMKRGVPEILGPVGQSGTPGVPGSPGHLEVKLYRLKAATWNTISLPCNNFEFLYFKIDLKLGTISIKETCEEVSENLAVAFGISLLHVLCEPRHKDWVPGKPKPKPIARGSKQVNIMSGDDMLFLRAVECWICACHTQ